MKIFILIRGGWDKSIDEIPEPHLLAEQDLPEAIGEMIDYMIDDPGIADPGNENIYPLSIYTGLPHNAVRSRALKLIEDMSEASVEGATEWLEARNELTVMMKHELIKHGRLEMIQFWDCYEGSFFGIFAKEI